jgi:hypothetical protein
LNIFASLNNLLKQKIILKLTPSANHPRIPLPGTKLLHGDIPVEEIGELLAVRNLKLGIKNLKYFGISYSWQAIPREIVILVQS